MKTWGRSRGETDPDTLESAPEETDLGILHQQGETMQVTMKTIEESRRDAGGDAAAFWGDRARLWIAETLKAHPNTLDEKWCEQYAVRAATYAATCARLSQGAE